MFWLLVGEFNDVSDFVEGVPIELQPTADNLRAITLVDYSAPTTYILRGVDKIKDKAILSTILKITEEPPENFNLICVVTSISNIPIPIVDRAYVVQNYGVPQIAGADLEEFCQSIYGHATSVPLSNLFRVSTRLKINDESSKNAFDVIEWLDCMKTTAKTVLINSEQSAYYSYMLLQSAFDAAKSIVQMNGISTTMIVDDVLITVRQVLEELDASSPTAE